MKLFLLSFAFVANIFVSCKGLKEKEIPSIVINSLSAKFENANNVEWKKKKDLYEAEFELNKVIYKALINFEGKILKFKHPIESSRLPPPVINIISSRQHNLVIKEAEKVEKDTLTLFQIELEEENRKQKLVITSNGMIANNERYW